MLSALRALFSADWKGRVRVLLAGDEENGHRLSTGLPDLIEAARGVRFGLNFETGFPDNAVVVERKGVANFRVDLRGVGAHVGNAPDEGRSAITELAAKIGDINALSDPQVGTLLNVDIIGGGTVPNACPENAWCVIDVRFSSAAELERVRRGLFPLENRCYVDKPLPASQSCLYFLQWSACAAPCCSWSVRTESHRSTVSRRWKPEPSAEVPIQPP